MKRLFDLVLTTFGTILISPLLLFVAYKIQKEDPGPVIFSHTRVGKNGKEFSCYKFRTMVINSEKVLNDYLQQNPSARLEWEQNFKLKNDPRITPIGEFLRTSSLDELPQIFNVLKGDMSLVGPRPVVREELDKYYREATKDYCSVRPGITGIWQVSGRNDVSYDKRVAMDVEYVRTHNLWMDIVLLYKTVDVVWNKKGAY